MVTGLTSIIIPSRNEIFLNKTIQDILAKAHGPIEVIAVLDAYWPSEVKREHWSTPAIIEDPRVHYLHIGEHRGMRNAINKGVALSTGEFILKSDGHCMFDQGFDEILKKNIEDNWIVIPRRKRLDAEKWAIQIQPEGKPDVDYEFLSSPTHDGAKGAVWTKRILERLGKPEYMLDEDMSFQGSCYFMTRKHWDWLGGLQEEGYGTFVREAQEIGLKTWLGGGKLMVNKNTWYAHLHKGPFYGRGYFIDKRKMIEGEKYCDKTWYGNEWKGAIHDMAWFIERFGGEKVPGWTKELIDSVRKK